MLDAVIRFSLRYRMLVIFVSLAALIYGSYVTAHLPIDVFPDLDRPRVVILAEAHNMAPEEIETLITFPIEASVLGATGVQAVRSQSAMGQSVVNVEFDWNVPIFTARQIVQERLSSIEGTLPAGIRPQLGPVSSMMGQIMLVGIARQTGPGGGELANVGKTPYMAELLTDGPRNGTTLAIWNPRTPAGKRYSDPHQWQPVPISADTLTLSFVMPHQQIGTPLADAGETPIKPMIFQRDPNDPARFHAKDNRPPGISTSFHETERRIAIPIEQALYDVTFDPASRQELELRTTADWTIRPRLMKIPGIAQVLTLGGGRKQYQVLVDPLALNRYDVTLQQIEEALKKNNLNTSGGYAVQGDREKPIRVFARLGPERQKVLREIEQIVVKTTPNRNLLVKDVARVTEGAQLKRGEASVNGLPGVLMIVRKQPHNDTRAVTGDVVTALEEIEQSLPADIVVNPNIFRMQGFIDRAIFNVGEALVIGAVLVLIILFLFLLNFRTTFISLTAIPLSLVITGLVFRATGWFTGTELSINVMTLGGIAVALGELVDDAIVDVENIFRRLRENNLLEVPRSAIRVVYEASIEVRGAIVFGTAMVILVFIPLFALSGMEGRLFAPLGVAYIVSILASLLVSLTVTPVLSYYLLPQSSATHRHEDSPLLRWLKWAATPLIRFSMNWAGTLLMATWALVLVFAWLLTQIGADFLPPFDEGSVQVNFTLPSGASLDASNEITRIVDRKFRSMQKNAKNPDGEVLQFSRRSGRAENDEETEPVNVSEYILTINPEAERSRAEILKHLLDELTNQLPPGVEIEAEQPLQHLIGHMLTGVKAQIAIKVFGDDLNVLRKVAEDIKHHIKDVPGITPPIVETQEMTDELHLTIRPEKLAYYGVDRAFVAEFISTALKGEEVTQIIDGQRRFDLVVRLEERFRTDYANLGSLRIELPDKRGTVALRELVNFDEHGMGANQISRENARRRIVVRCNTQGRDLASVVEDIKSIVEKEVAKPPGYFIEFGGVFENQVAATRLISVLAILSLAGMYVVLYMLFPSARIVLQILNALPTAFIGGVLALLVTQQSLTVASMVGFISLGGIAARNGILLVTHYFHLMKHEGETFSEDMILRGSLERLSPVLMTALTAGIGLIPLVYGGQAPGREILYPVATVILGGLITSTLCEFLIHPGIFWRFSGKDAEQLVLEMEHEDELELTEQSPNE
jgi:CzcA family heavy metal efflux pump